MEPMINLSDLLKHEILDLYSAEEQIIEALPGMIDKAKNPELKKALREHLKVTQEQKRRLDKVKELLGEKTEDGKKKGFFSRLFGGGGEKCKGMEGLISEGQKIMKADITDEALDAAIIASAQKIEHYEICGYGTAKAFARELNLPATEQLLTQTLNEEYTADDLLTALAVGKLNTVAENASESANRRRRNSSRDKSSKNKVAKSSSLKAGNKTGAKAPEKEPVKKAVKKAAQKNALAKKSTPKSVVKNANTKSSGKSKSSSRK